MMEGGVEVIEVMESAERVPDGSGKDRLDDGEMSQKRRRLPRAYFELGKVVVQDQREEAELVEIGSALVAAYSTTSSGVSEGDEVLLHSDADAPDARVRCRVRDRDVGRLNFEASRHVGRLLWHGILRPSGTVTLIDGPKLRVNTPILMHITFYVHRSIFSDVQTAGRAKAWESVFQRQVMDLMRFFNFITEKWLDGGPPKAEDREKRNLFSDNASKVLSEEEKAVVSKVPGLKCTLHDYQKLGVSWMVARERGTMQFTDKSNPLWVPARAGETDFFYNRGSGTIALESPAIAGCGFAGGILADEMGLGKTVQTIAMMLVNGPEPVGAGVSAPRRGGTLIVCPLAVLSQWVEELATHAEGLRVVRFHGPMRNATRWHEVSLERTDVTVTTYNCLGFDYGRPNHERILMGMNWHRVVLDEAHYIKGHGSQTSRAAAELEGHFLWCLTGTPIQNNPSELYSLLRFLKVEPWNEWRYWNEHVLKGYRSGDADGVSRAEDCIRLLLQPLMLRRTRGSMGSDGKKILELPDIEREVCKLRPSAAERDVYDALYHQSKIRFETFVSAGTVLQSYYSVLDLLMKLRMCCDHPNLVFRSIGARPDGDSIISIPDMKELEKRFLNQSGDGRAGQVLSQQYKQKVLEDIQESRDDKDKADAECPICLDVMEAPVYASCAHAACRDCFIACFGGQDVASCPVCRSKIVRGQLMSVGAPERRGSSAIDLERNWTPSEKVARLLEDLKAIQKRGDGEKALVFSQWTNMLNILEIALSRSGHRFNRIDGSVPEKERVARIQEFSESADVNVMLISLKAGGIGLNLTAANHVFLMDPWWNPAVEEQAIGRVYRIGQTRRVYVKRYILADTVEDRLLQVQERKRLLVDGVVEESGADSKTVRLEEVKYLFS